MMIEWGHGSGRAVAASGLIDAPSDGNRRFTGTDGDDVIRGSKGDNYLDLSQGGNDIVDGRSGDDIIYFGATLTSSDFLDGFKGSDRLVLQGDYSEGIELNGSFIRSIERVILLISGKYTISGDCDFGTKSGLFYLDGSNLGANDWLRFDGSDATRVTTVIGGDGNDNIRGGNHGCSIIGGDGDDCLVGGDRNGVLYGDGGADYLASGGGATAFIYIFEDDSGRKASDLIVGFKYMDEINLSSVDADTTQDGDQAFHFGRTAGHAGDLIVHYNAALDLTIVKAFTDDDAKADMEIHLAGHVPLTPADFAL